MKRISSTICALIVMLLIGGFDADANVSANRLDIDRDARLSQTHVANIIQDSVGFVWMATWSGLVRYDGYSSHFFKPIQCSDGTIDSNRIYNIKFNRAGGIWCVSSDNKLFLFDPQESRFANISLNIKEISDKKVKVLTPLKNGFTWVTFADGSLLRLDDRAPLAEPIFYSLPASLVDNATKINRVELTTLGEEWVLTDKGAFNYSRRKTYPGNYLYAESYDDNTFLIGHDGYILDTSHNSLWRLTPSAQLKITDRLRDSNRLFLASDAGVFRINLADCSVKRYSQNGWEKIFKDSRHRVWTVGNSEEVMVIAEGNEPDHQLLRTTKANDNSEISRPFLFETTTGQVILKTASGVISVFNPERGSLDPLVIANGNHERQANSGIKKFMADSIGNLWLLYARDIACLNFSNNNFRQYTETSDDDEIRALEVDSRGRLWRGTRGGTVETDGISLSTGPAYAIKQSPNGEIWVGTKGNGLWILTCDGDGKLLKTSNLRNGAIHSDTIYDIAFDRNGTAWIGSYGNGLAKARFDGKSWVFAPVKNQPAGMKVRHILPDDSGNLLIATADGLVVTDAQSSDSPRFFKNKYRKEAWGLKGNDVMSVVKSGNQYYISVFGAGISRIDSRDLLSDSLHFTNYEMKGADSDQIRSMIASGNDIFVFAGRSVGRLSTPTGHFSVLSAEALPPGTEFSECAPALFDNRVMAGFSEGVIEFDPSDMSGVRPDRQLAVAGIVFQGDVAETPLSNPSGITIHPNQRNFAILLSDFDFGTKDERRIRYRFADDNDSQWTYINGNRPTALFNNIAPGKHTLIFEKEDSEGRWATARLPLTIDVVPEFVETSTFKILAVMLFICAIAGLIFLTVYFRRMRDAVQRRYSLLMAVDRISDNNIEGASEGNQAADIDDEAKIFIEKTVEYLDENLTNPDLIIEDFARHMGLSRTGFYNRMKEITGCSPIEFIRQMRIKKSLPLLRIAGKPVAEVAYEVGYSDPKYFTRCFKSEMGMTPTQYQSASCEKT